MHTKEPNPLITGEQKAKLDALEHAQEGQFRDRMAENELPRGAMRVQPYKPNRKQRRIQAAMKRKGK